MQYFPHHGESTCSAQGGGDIESQPSGVSLPSLRSIGTPFLCAFETWTETCGLLTGGISMNEAEEVLRWAESSRERESGCCWFGSLPYPPRSMERKQERHAKVP